MEPTESGIALPSEECDWCHDLFYTHDLILLDGEGFVCKKCLAQYLENGK